MKIINYCPHTPNQMNDNQNLSRYAEGEYNPTRIDERFLELLKRIEKLPNFQEMKVNFEEVKKRAQLLTEDIKNNFQFAPQLKKIQKLLSLKLNRTPNKNELSTKIYSLALRIQLEVDLNKYLKLPYPSKIPEIFGDNVKVCQRENLDPNLRTSTQSKQITYVFYRLLGEGTFNHAYEVYCIENPGQFVARELKSFVSPYNSQKQNQNALNDFRFWQIETNIHLYLLANNVPGIIGIKAVYSSFEGNGISGLIQEQGLGDLNDFHGMWDDYLLNSTMRQIFTTLMFIHKLGIIHRDLKPANIFPYITNKGEMITKIGDFGLASKIGAPQDSTGTYAYTPLEGFLLNNHVFGPSIDTWSAGVIALQLKYNNKYDPMPAAFDEEYTTLINEIVELNHTLFYQISQYHSVRDRIRGIMYHFKAKFPQLTQSPLLNYIMNNPSLYNYAAIHDEIILQGYFPLLSDLMKRVKSTLNLNIPYDRMIAGLLEVNPNHRISLQEAYELIS